MKTSKHRARTRRATFEQRTQLLAAFERSGKTAAAFARRHRLNYTTFCGWRQRQAKTAPGFVQVELPPPAAPADLSGEASTKAQLVIELGGSARLRLTSVSQLELAVRLLQALNPAHPC